MRSRFDVTLNMPWATDIVRQGEIARTPVTLSTGTLLMHEVTDWTMQGCAGFENPVLISHYRIIGGELAGGMARAVKFLDMHWQMFDEASMLHPVVPEEGRRGRGGGRAYPIDPVAIATPPASTPLGAQGLPA